LIRMKTPENLPLENWSWLSAFSSKEKKSIIDPKLLNKQCQYLTIPNDLHT
jgi:hypothetical protein